MLHVASTRLLAVREANPDDEAIRAAAKLLREGGIVAFPTETVYGLGAAVSREDAVRRIFVAKGRPSGVPLIVHVRDWAQALEHVRDVPAVAGALAGQFWPGPLTLVLARSARVGRTVTGGGETVGVRAPAHPVALALIAALGEPIAAPSANPFHRLPPVRAQHVLSGLGGRIDGVLDGGRCPGGLESTVVALTAEGARVLRRGAVAVEALRGAGMVSLEEPPEAELPPDAGEAGWLRLVETGGVGALLAGVGAGRGLVVHEGAGDGECNGWLVRRLPSEPDGYAAAMYDVLHGLADRQCTQVWVSLPSAEPAWMPLRDRLIRLASGMR